MLRALESGGFLEATWLSANQRRRQTCERACRTFGQVNVRHDTYRCVPEGVLKSGRQRACLVLDDCQVLRALDSVAVRHSYTAVIICGDSPLTGHSRQIVCQFLGWERYGGGTRRAKGKATQLLALELHSQGIYVCALPALPNVRLLPCAVCAGSFPGSHVDDKLRAVKKCWAQDISAGFHPVVCFQRTTAAFRCAEACILREWGARMRCLPPNKRRAGGPAPSITLVRTHFWFGKSLD